MMLVMKAILIKALGGYLMKSLIIKWVLPSVIDFLIAALKNLAMKSDNQIDDALVNTIAGNRDRVIEEIKQSL